MTWYPLKLLVFASLIGCTAEVPEGLASEHAPLRAEVPTTCSDVDISAIWRPQPGVSWDWQLQSRVDKGVDAQVYDIDPFIVDEKLIASLHASGRKVVCYINVGAWEPYRPDAAKFPESVLGKAWSETEFQDERWLDIRRLDILGPLLTARFDMAKQKGCDAIEPDNIDGYDASGNGSDRTGFKLTYNDQLTFNRFIACEAHKRGMAVALKNDSDQVRDLVGDFDFAVSEQCYYYKECAAYKPFRDANKAVLVAEYVEDLGQESDAKFAAFCAEGKKLGLSTILKKRMLDSWIRTCPP